MNFLDNEATKTAEPGVNTGTNRSLTETPKLLPRRWIATATVFVACLLLVSIVQRKAGAQSAEFGGFPDESAHYIGGLALHDYMATALGKNPIAFLRDYHLRLPFFAIGVWPPFFYFLEGAWMEVFGVDRTSVLWMIAVSAAGLATLLFWILRREFDFWTAVPAAAAFFLIPVVQWSSCLVMADLTCSLLALASIVFFARFVERGQWRDSALFGILAGLSLLTKNSTYFIVLVPPMVIAAGRRWDLLRNRALWLAPVIAGTIYAPWLLVSRQFLLLGTHGLQLPGFVGTQVDYVTILWRQMSLLLPVGVAGGVLLVCSKRKMSALAMCMLAVIPAVSVAIFVARVPVQDRLLMVSYCALLFLATEACAALLRPPRRAGAIMACVLVFGYFNWMKFRRPPVNEIHDAVGYIQKLDGQYPGAVLVPSGSEGPWIAEFAETEPRRPQRILLRPTKVLGSEDWNGTNWQPYYKSLDEIRTFFERTPVRYCILVNTLRRPAPSEAPDESLKIRTYPHDALLEVAVAANPAEWRLLLERTTANGGSYRVFQNLRWTPASEQRVYAEVSRVWTKYLP